MAVNVKSIMLTGKFAVPAMASVMIRRPNLRRLSLSSINSLPSGERNRQNVALEDPGCHL